jgi:hypothetical protein
MHDRLGFSVRIFVPFGEPEGLRVIEKSGWTGQGLVFPRSRLADVRRREDLGRSGVYVLWGPGDSEQLPSVYVGEGDVDARLAQHAKAKDFWTHGVAFTSKDQSLKQGTYPVSRSTPGRTCGRGQALRAGQYKYPPEAGTLGCG